MPASGDQITAVKEAIQARADAQGSAGGKLSFGTPGGVIEIEGLGKETTGNAWNDSGDPMSMLVSGFADWILDKALPPVGTILPFAGALGSLPAGWQAADGTNGTPNLAGFFLKGAASAGGSGGSSTTSGPSATTSINNPAAGTPTNVASADHTHEHEPPYYEIVWVIRVA